MDAEHSAGFPNATWLIGNHSDELTPWLPILATRSGPSCKVFALPCCPFGLYGKYNNFVHGEQAAVKTRCEENISAHGSSRYRVYIGYLRSLFLACGFITEVDVLRIPSTKRVSSVFSLCLPSLQSVACWS